MVDLSKSELYSCAVHKRVQVAAGPLNQSAVSRVFFRALKTNKRDGHVSNTTPGDK